MIPALACLVLAHVGPCTAPETITTLAVVALAVVVLVRPWRRSESLKRRGPALTACLVLVGALTLTGCGGSGNKPTTTTAVSRPTSAAKLRIVRPAANEVTGPDTTIQLELTGAHIVPQTTGPLRGDEGHIHVSVDGKLVSMAFGTTQDLHALTPGPHTLQAEFVAADHVPFRNRVTAAVIFQVKP